MNEPLFLLLTAVPVALGIALGRRLGGRRMLRLMFTILFALFLGGATAYIGYQQAWFWPVGLVTPALAGIVLTAGYWIIASVRQTRRSPKIALPLTRLDRTTGFVLGTIGGILFAITGWLAILLAIGYSTESTQVAQHQAIDPALPPAKPHDWARSLAETAYRGFLRHLPVANTLGKELEAVGMILRMPVERRREYAQSKHWDDLIQLPSFQAIIDDPMLMDDLRLAGEGDLPALYRLQRDPLVIAFVQEEAIQEILSEFRASNIASELVELETPP